MLEIFPDPHPDPRLSIPFNAARVLPDDNESVPDLLRHVLPSPLTTSYRLSISPWSDSPPFNITLPVLATHLVPPKVAVDKLLSEVADLPLAVQSIHRAAILPGDTLPERLPIWILSFWQQVYKTRQLRHQWNTCRKWVTSKPCAGVNLLDRLDQTLLNVRWQGYLNGLRRDRCVKDIFDLLSNLELNSGQINDLLELIENKLVASSDGIAPPHLVAPTELALLLTSSYENRDIAGHRKRPLQISIEDDLIGGRKSSVASVAWISSFGCGHWVSYTVNPASLCIAYGDSLGKPIPEMLLAVLQWWLLDIREKMNLTTTGLVVVNPLPVTSQDDDFSCGILATNSIGHHLLYETLPLVGQDPISIKTYRTERTIEILMLDAEFVRVDSQKK